MNSERELFTPSSFNQAAECKDLDLSMVQCYLQR